MEISVFWFRRDLRIEDNTGLNQALASGRPVLPIFIFDKKILNELDKDDARVSFIYDSLKSIHERFQKFNSSIKILIGDPLEEWKRLLKDYSIKRVYINKDYEPYAIIRDGEVIKLLKESGIEVDCFKDHVIYEENDILKNDGKSYTVYTPYKNKWLERFKNEGLNLNAEPVLNNLVNLKFDFPSINEIGFEKSSIKVKDFDLSIVPNYDEYRNIPSKEATSNLSTHLRFGTVSVRQIIDRIGTQNQSFLNELIWREFFIQILFQFPHVVTDNFKSKYNFIQWRNNEEEFKSWCEGRTGYPLVDAGMRELNKTGFMHNRVRMVVASFLCKHLLIDWKWGEAYFAKKLLDYELASNNGNWQWSAGTGCDAAPYFRVFNPSEQLKKFDKNLAYVKKWVPEVLSFNYPKPVVDHAFARKRALEVYKVGLQASAQ